MTKTWHDILPSGAEESLLVRTALTHKSFGKEHNERLEFLGDAILEWVISDWLYRQRKQWDEGGMSRVRASLVNRNALASVGARWGIDRDIKLSASAKTLGADRNPRIIAGAVEAMIGAAHLLTGPVATRAFVIDLLSFLLEAVPKNSDCAKDAKTTLQEMMQRNGHLLPLYRVVCKPSERSRGGYIVHCMAAHVGAIGDGRTCKDAEQRAAERCLNKLRRDKT